MLDLHTHSTRSDGTLGPSALVEAARQAGLTALSICDHDTIAAYDALPPRVEGIELVPGLELSCEYPRGTFHLLAYHYDLCNRELNTALDELRVWRTERNIVIVRKMTELGLPITMAELQAKAGKATPGRPHMAQLLVERGVVASVAEAFDRYLAAGRPCYAPKSRLAPAKAIALVHRAGGAAVLAHPYQLGLTEQELAEELAGWVAQGLDGLEVYYSRHTSEMTACYEGLAARHGLCRTAGSDFHGALKPGIELGGFAGDPPPDQAMLDELQAAASRWR